MFTHTFPKNKGGIAKLHIVSENKKRQTYKTKLHVHPHYLFRKCANCGTAS